MRFYSIQIYIAVVLLVEVILHGDTIIADIFAVLLTLITITNLLLEVHDSKQNGIGDKNGNKGS